MSQYSRHLTGLIGWLLGEQLFHRDVQRLRKTLQRTPARESLIGLVPPERVRPNPRHLCKNHLLEAAGFAQFT